MKHSLICSAILAAVSIQQWWVGDHTDAAFVALAVILYLIGAYCAWEAKHNG